MVNKNLLVSCSLKPTWKFYDSFKKKTWKFNCGLHLTNFIETRWANFSNIFVYEFIRHHKLKQNTAVCFKLVTEIVKSTVKPFSNKAQLLYLMPKADKFRKRVNFQILNYNISITCFLVRNLKQSDVRQLCDRRHYSADDLNSMWLQLMCSGRFQFYNGFRNTRKFQKYFWEGR